MPQFTGYFAQLAGLYFVILAIILLVRRRAMTELMSEMVENAPFIFLTGTIRIIIGLAILIGNGPLGSSLLAVIVAIVGWITLTRGVSMLLAEKRQQQFLIAFWQRAPAYYGGVLIVLVLGLYLARAGAM
jgi:hypothetical protein